MRTCSTEAATIKTSAAMTISLINSESHHCLSFISTFDHQTPCQVAAKKWKIQIQFLNRKWNIKMTLFSLKWNIDEMIFSILDARWIMKGSDASTGIWIGPCSVSCSLLANSLPIKRLNSRIWLQPEMPTLLGGWAVRSNRIILLDSQ